MSSMSWRVNGSTTWPRCGSSPTIPSPRSFSSASRTGVTLTPSSAAVSSRRMNVPERRAPDMMAARRWPATSSDNCARRRGSWLRGFADRGAFTWLARTFRVGPGLPGTCRGLGGGLLLGRSGHSVTQTTSCFIKYQPGARDAQVKGREGRDS
ncbi:Uncharacterised protein [Mycobacterium tuberculosis]|nr:Uncharacterised protein [Mycobacterium tuberculosis]